MPLLAALQLGGVDGPVLCLDLANYTGLDNHVNLSWLEDGTISKDLVNVFIAMEINGWVDFVRLPAVIAATPTLTKMINARRAKL